MNEPRETGIYWWRRSGLGSPVQVYVDVRDPPTAFIRPPGVHHALEWMMEHGEFLEDESKPIDPSSDI